MPLAPQSPAASRVNVTEIVGRYRALAIDVIRADGQVAISASTGRGIIVLTIPEAEFVAKARGPRDSNNNPFREPKRAEPAPQEPAAIIPIPLPGPTPLPPVGPIPRSRGSRAAKGQAAAVCAQAWEWHQQNLRLTLKQVAERFYLQEGTYATWLARFHPGALRRLRIAAGLSIAPKRGQIEQARPLITKPGGRLL